MSAPHVEQEELEGLALGELSEARAAAVEEHARACAECGAELRLIRAEIALLARRAAAAPPLDPKIWHAVQARTSGENVIPLQRKRRPWLLAGAGAAIAAAAALAVIVRPAPRPVAVQTDAGAAPAAAEDDDAVGPDVLAALDRAEGDYRKAVQVLEAELAASGVDPATSKGLQRTRDRLAAARTVAANDPQARMRVLSGYSAYLRSLQRAVDSEEASP